MAYLVTVSDVLTRARQEADKENDPHISASEELAYFRQSWARLYGVYAKAYPERYRTVQSIATTGAASYTVDATYMGTIGVDYKVDATTWEALEEMQEEERNIFNGTSTGRAYGYRVLGDGTSAALNLYPTPPSGQTYRHIYLPTATTIASTSSQVDVMNGHDRWLELDIAIRMLRKEESDTRAQMEERDRILADVLEEAQMRAVLNPRRIAVLPEQSWDPASWRR